jgi:lysophospholipase L1-like esterase
MPSHVKDSRNGRRWTFSWIYVVYLVVSAVVVLEVGARVLLDNVDSGETVLSQAFPRLLNSAVIGGDDAPLGVHLTPDVERTVAWGELTFHVRTNSLGFRGAEPEPRATGEYRVLFLGDSMVFGHGLEEEETLPLQVQQLAQTGRGAVIAFNGAISGMNTVQELATARQLLPIMTPDQVILGYFVGNDPLANIFTRMDEAGRVTFHDDSVGQLRSRLDEHLRPLLGSVAFRAVALRYYVPRLRYFWSGQAETLDRSVELVRRIRDVSEQAGAQFAVVMIYPRDGVAGGLVSLLSGSRGVGQRLTTRLRDADVSVLDSGEFMGGDGADERFYFANDGHLNAAGARAMAAMVGEQLVLPGLQLR